MSDQYVGQQSPSSGNAHHNMLGFIHKQMMGRIATATMVKIINVYHNGDVAPIGVVDVQQMVNQIDGPGNKTDHGIIYGLPYTRIFSGPNAIIIDPKVGDIGIAVFADRDISKVKATAAPANPGSRRRFDMADGMYVGGLPLATTPTRYIQFTDSGINVVGPDNFTVNVKGNVSITATGNIAINSGGIVDINS